MTKEDLYARGERLLSDAVFIREHFIPMALTAQRWNICLFECYRVLEIAVKAIHLVSGYEPKETHEIHKLIVDLQNCISSEKYPPPFIYTLFDGRGNSLGLRIVGRYIVVCRRTPGEYVHLGGTSLDSLSVDQAVHLKLECTDGIWQLVDNQDKVLLRASDPLLRGTSTRIRRTLVRSPKQEILERLMEIGTDLRERRELAFYHTQLYTEPDARSAVALMEQAFDALRVFFVIDTPDSIGES